jgi:peptide/nickel transport system permease protein
MLRFSALRIAVAVPVMLVVVLCTFLIFQFLPGGAAEAILGENATPAAVATLQHALGLDKPMLERFLGWLGNVLTGDLGHSLVTPESVGHALASHAEVTGFLVLYSLLFGLLLGIPIGVLAGAYRDRWWSQLLMGISAVGISVPRFFGGVLLAMLFAVHLGWLPATGYVPLSDGLAENLRSLVLPCLALGVSQAAHFARVVRASIAEVMGSDYVRYARSKGCAPARVIWRHALPNALTATIMTVAISLGSLVSGALVVEVVFALPGLGTLMFRAVQNRDVPILQGVILVITVGYILTTLLADIVHALCDPRVRRSV